MLFDLGCNTGEYCEVALSSGAKRAVGFDFDQGALERAYARAKDKNLELLPLFLDAANPSPDQGWNMKERPGLTTRCKADAVMALAFEHHLAIARNIPLDQVVDWLVGMAPTGVIEFVHKSDPTVQQLLALREDIFDDYTSEAFEAAIESAPRSLRNRWSRAQVGRFIGSIVEVNLRENLLRKRDQSRTQLGEKFPPNPLLFEI